MIEKNSYFYIICIKRSPKALALHKQEKEHFGSRLKCNIIFIFFQWVAYENNFLQRH